MGSSTIGKHNIIFIWETPSSRVDCEMIPIRKKNKLVWFVVQALIHVMIPKFEAAFVEAREPSFPTDYPKIFFDKVDLRSSFGLIA